MPEDAQHVCVVCVGVITRLFSYRPVCPAWASISAVGRYPSRAWYRADL